MSLRYGFQRLVLLGSAGYQRAELPLDDSVSLIAPNNTGKTALINALQYLLIIDKRRMDFGAHSADKSRRFYFPNNSAFILLEVMLPETGSLVLGASWIPGTYSAPQQNLLLFGSIVAHRAMP